MTTITIVQRKLDKRRQLADRTRSYFENAAEELGVNVIFKGHNDPNVLTGANAVYVRSIGPYVVKTAYIARNARRQNIPLVDEYIARKAQNSEVIRPHSKREMYNLFVNNNIYTPPTVPTTTKEIIAHDYDLSFLPLTENGISGTHHTVMKISRGGRQGIGVYGIRKAEHIRRAIEDISARFPQKEGVGREVLIQRNIKNNGDIRVIVVGDRVIGGLLRGRKRRYKMMTRSKGRSRGLCNIPEDVCNASVQAAQALGITFASVDMVREVGTGKICVIEVNSAPSFHTFNKHHRNAAVDILSYLCELAERGGDKYYGE